MPAKSKTKTAAIDKNQLLVDRIVDLLAIGLKPWQRPWKAAKDGASFQNLVTRKPYRGFNPMLCSTYNMSYGYESPYYLSFNQIKEFGWQLKKGSKAVWIRFAKQGTTEVEAENGETTTKGYFYQSWSAVYPTDCIDDTGAELTIQSVIDRPDLTPDNPDERDIDIDTFISNIGANIEYRGDRAYYSATEDRIVMPKWELFKNKQYFHATQLHELFIRYKHYHIHNNNNGSFFIRRLKIESYKY
jgi:antirestriction protein ArdC